MSGRRMLRDLMTVSDVYQYADSIMEMLREEYGSYDADALDEVMIEEVFARRLLARGYDVRPWVDDVPASATPSAPPAPPAPAPSDAVVPVTIVRRGRPPASGNANNAAERSTERPATPAPRRGRPPGSTNKTTRPAASTDGAAAPKSDGARNNTGNTPAPRARRTSRNNGDSEA